MAKYTVGDIFNLTAANLMRELWKSSTAPSSPGTDEVYVDDSGNDPIIKYYTGSVWKPILSFLIYDNAAAGYVSEPYMETGAETTAAASTNYNKSFNNAYTSAPQVIAGFGLAGTIGQLSISAITTTQFTYRTGTVGGIVRWVSIGEA